LKLKQPLLVAGVVSSVAIATAFGVHSAQAATASTNRRDDLISKIADKFHLKKDDVKAVFDEDKAAREAERDKAVEAKLTQDETDGKITAAQKSAILAKRAEIKAERQAKKDDSSNQTREQRRKEMQAKRTELETWAKENNIPDQYVGFVFGGGRRGLGHGGPNGFNGPTPTSSDTTVPDNNNSSVLTN
jgi:hypothetical protein